MRRPSSSNSSAAAVIEMPRSCSSAIQSEVACLRALRPRTAPASSIAPAYSSSFSVSVVLPASGWEMMAKVRRRETSRSSSLWSDASDSAGTLFSVAQPQLLHRDARFQLFEPVDDDVDLLRRSLAQVALGVRRRRHHEQLLAVSRHVV